MPKSPITDEKKTSQVTRKFVYKQTFSKQTLFQNKKEKTKEISNDSRFMKKMLKVRKNDDL